jgi:Raf kinase inhibitor-like YbhB/YbcL family protein
MSSSLSSPEERTFVLLSSAFRQGEKIPSTYSSAGDNLSPPLVWTGEPRGTRCFVLVLEGRRGGAKGGDSFVHWLVCNILLGIHSFAEGAATSDTLGFAIQGRNDRGEVGYSGIDNKHELYAFRIFALASKLSPLTTPTKKQLYAAMDSRILETAELCGWYDGP